MTSAKYEGASVAESELQEESPRLLVFHHPPPVRTSKNQIWATAMSRTFCGSSKDGTSPGVVMKRLFGNQYVLLKSHAAGRAKWPRAPPAGRSRPRPSPWAGSAGSQGETLGKGGFVQSWRRVSFLGAFSHSLLTPGQGPRLVQSCLDR